MKLSAPKIRVKSNGLVEFFSDVFFVILLLSQFLFFHTRINQISIVLFIVIVILLIIKKRTVKLNGYFLFAFLFIVIAYIDSINGNSINSMVSIAMTKTMAINLVVSFFLYQYFYHNAINKSMILFSKTVTFFTIIMVLLSYKTLFNGRLSPSLNLLILNMEYNPNFIALMAGFAFVFSYYLHKTYRKDYAKLLWLVSVVLLSGSRKGIFLIVMGAFLIDYLLNGYSKVKNIIKYLMVFILLYLLVMKIPIF